MRTLPPERDASSSTCVETGRISESFAVDGLAPALFVCAADFTGSVVSVLDGDTIDGVHNSHSDRI